MLQVDCMIHHQNVLLGMKYGRPLKKTTYSLLLLQNVSEEYSIWLKTQG